MKFSILSRAYAMSLQVTLSNGIANVTLSIPDGLVTNISYGGIDNLLATQNVKNDRGYN